MILRQAGCNHRVMTNRTAPYLRASTDNHADRECELHTHIVALGLDVVRVYAEKISTTDVEDR